MQNKTNKTIKTTKQILNLLNLKDNTKSISKVSVSKIARAIESLQNIKESFSVSGDVLADSINLRIKDKSYLNEFKIPLKCANGVNYAR